MNDTRRPGRPRKDVTKDSFSIRLSPDVVAALQADGTGWRGRVDGILRKALIG